MELTTIQDCSQWNTCSSCIAHTGCGYCNQLESCVQASWIGTESCPLSDTFYQQCHVSLALISGVMLTILLIGLALLCCCLCRHNAYEEQEEEEGRPLLNPNDRSLRRTSTYYQWNQPPPKKQVKHQPSFSADELSAAYQNNWEGRKKALLKKYERPPS
ncbi:hypothetical protein BD560DRAFT_386999 [Blakeslea trispora]|nr:hypothetical protein BD560DRAFT_386999 [Blakeslea trispora]